MTSENELKAYEKVKAQKAKEKQKTYDKANDALQPVLGLIGLIMTGCLFFAAEFGLFMLCYMRHMRIAVFILASLITFMFCVGLWHDTFAKMCYAKRKK